MGERRFVIALSVKIFCHGNLFLQLCCMSTLPPGLVSTIHVVLKLQYRMGSPRRFSLMQIARSNLSTYSIALQGSAFGKSTTIATATEMSGRQGLSLDYR